MERARQREATLRAQLRSANQRAEGATQTYAGLLGEVVGTSLTSQAGPSRLPPRVPIRNKGKGKDKGKGKEKARDEEMDTS